MSQWNLALFQKLTQEDRPQALLRWAEVRMFSYGLRRGIKLDCMLWVDKPCAIKQRWKDEW